MLTFSRRGGGDLHAPRTCSSGRGDHAIVTWPAYQSLHEVARATGADVTLHELRASEGWAIDVDRLRASVTPRTKLIVVNAPHNPTGMLPDAATWAAVSAIAADAGAVLFSDEVYRFLERDPAARLTAGADLGPHGVSLGVMSKSFSMAGLRIGWLASRDRAFLDAVRAVQGLPHDLLVGAVGDPRADRAPGARHGPRPLAARSSTGTSRWSTACSSARRRTCAGSARRAARSASRS